MLVWLLVLTLGGGTGWLVGFSLHRREQARLSRRWTAKRLKAIRPPLK